MTRHAARPLCRYVRVDTQADEKAATYPQPPGQLELGRLLVSELQAMGLRDASQDEHGIVMATLPATAASRPDHRLDRPRRHLAGNQRPGRQAHRSRAITTAATSSCPATRPR